MFTPVFRFPKIAHIFGTLRILLPVLRCRIYHITYHYDFNFRLVQGPVPLQMFGFYKLGHDITAVNTCTVVLQKHQTYINYISKYVDRCIFTKFKQTCLQRQIYKCQCRLLFSNSFLGQEVNTRSKFTCRLSVLCILSLSNRLKL